MAHKTFLLFLQPFCFVVTFSKPYLESLSFHLPFFHFKDQSEQETTRATLVMSEQIKDCERKPNESIQDFAARVAQLYGNHLDAVQRQSPARQTTQPPNDTRCKNNKKRKLAKEAGGKNAP